MKAVSWALSELAARLQNAAEWLNMARDGEALLPGGWRLMSQGVYDRLEREQWDMALEREHELLTRMTS